MAEIGGFIIKVRNLERCRTFYRDVMKLGEPVLDSNFRTEFLLNNNTRLILCQTREEEMFQQAVRSAIWIQPDNFEEQLDVLATCGYLPVRNELDLTDPDAKCFHDPEKNLIYLMRKNVS